MKTVTSDHSRKFLAALEEEQDRLQKKKLLEKAREIFKRVRWLRERLAITDPIE